MGLNQSKQNNEDQLTADDNREIKATKFTPGQITELKKIYINLSQQFKINQDENSFSHVFTDAMKMSNYEIGKLIYRSLNTNSGTDQFISFKDFVKGLNIFHPQSERKFLIAKVFDIYKDSSGIIRQEQIREIISISAANSDFMHLSEAKINNLATRIFTDFNEDNNDEIDANEFEQLVDKAPGLIESLRLNLDEIFP